MLFRSRWDVIVFHPPIDNGSVFAMRIVGLPAEHVTITDAGIAINGSPITPPPTLAHIRYVPREQTDSSATPAGEVTVPPDSFFVLGDNSLHANDSRFWGSVPRRDIVGKVLNK